MRTKTRDTSDYGFHYISGLIRLDSKRNMSHIGRQTGQPEQNMHHFISKSPWSGRDLIEALQGDMLASGVFTDAVLVIDESADEKSGSTTAGAGRQNNGRIGKVDMCQVGVFTSLVTPETHCWVDGELFFPKKWFSDEYKAKREQVGVPKNREFQTKIELAKELIFRAREQGLPFVAVTMDSLYGRSFSLRQQLQQDQIEYYADVPENTMVYLEKPSISYELKKNGEPSKNVIVTGMKSEVRYLLDHPSLESERINVRATQRGFLEATFCRLPVWTVKDDQVIQEWLLIRQHAKKKSYSLSNASSDTSLAVMAERKTHRYFIERDNQTSKSEFGWDEFQATKYLAWEHQLALTIMASWFVVTTILEWKEELDQDPELMDELNTDQLPSLSVRNVRELLRAAMPLPQLSAEQATNLVVKHLKNRSRSRTSRLKKTKRSRM